MLKQTPLGRELRSDFPIFVNNIQITKAGKENSLKYLDTAATAQKPAVVINAMLNFMQKNYGSVHRGAYNLSVQSSNVFEECRAKIAGLIGLNVPTSRVVITHGTTEGLNILANGLSEVYLNEKSRIVITSIEHHANLIPWQQAAIRKDCELAYIPLEGKQGDKLKLNLNDAKKIITPNTKIVSLAYVGNVLGQVNPLAEIITLAKQVGAIVVVDCAQSMASFTENLFELGADAIVFSGHKIYGPTGIGALVAKEELLHAMPPFTFGGGMISNVTLEESTWAPDTTKFEAGTPPVIEAAGLSAAIDWLQKIDRKRIHTHTSALAKKLYTELLKIPDMQVFFPDTGEETLVSFRHERIHAHDLATILDSMNIAVRAGHHCAWPLIRSLGVDALVRASFAAYSDDDDVEALVDGIKMAVKSFK